MSAVPTTDDSELLPSWADPEDDASAPAPLASRRTITALSALEDYCHATIEGTRPGLQLGIPTIDRATNGLQPGELVLMQGRTDSLKTMTYLTLILDLLRRYPGCVWVVVNMEMPPHQMIERLARKYLGLTLSALQAAVKAGDPVIAEFAALIGNLYFIDAGATTLLDIEDEARALVKHVAPRTLGGIFVDHCGLIRAERGSATGSYERATATAIGLKQLARSLNIVVVAVVQANRSGKAGEGEPVALESARDSGAYEENADFVLAFSSIVPAKDGRHPWVKCRLAKNRRGPQLAVTLTFDPRTLRMGEMVEESRGAA